MPTMSTVSTRLARRRRSWRLPRRLNKAAQRFDLLLARAAGFGDRLLDVKSLVSSRMASAACLERRGLAAGVPRIPRAISASTSSSGPSSLSAAIRSGAAARAPRTCGDEQFHVRVRRDDGADIAPVEDCAAGLAGELLLALAQRGANRRICRNRRSDPETGSVRSSGSSRSRARSSQARSASNSLSGSPPQRHRFNATAR